MSIRSLSSLLKTGSLAAELMRAVSSGALIQIGTMIIGLVSSSVLARILQVSEYGSYAFILSLCTVFSFAIQLGLPPLTVKETSKYEANKQWAHIRGLWRWSHIILMRNYLGALMLFAAFIYFNGSITQEPELIAVGCLLVPVLSLLNVQASQLHGMRVIAGSQAPNHLIRPFLLTIFVLFAYYFLAPPPTATDALSMHLMAALLASGIYYLLRERTKKQKMPGHDKDRSGASSWGKQLVPLALISSTYIIIRQTDILMLGFLRSTDETGIYKIAVSVASITLCAPALARLTVTPYIASFYEKGRIKQLQKLCNIGALLSFLPTLMLCIIFFFAGAPIIETLYGSDYLPALPALILLMAGNCLLSAFGSVDVLLYSLDYEKAVLKILAFSAALNIVLNWLLIPSYGVLGSAIATAITISLPGILMWIIALRKLNINSFILGFSLK